jgi:AsmA protein
VNAALGFKRLGLAAVAAVAVSIGMLALSSFLISAETAREAVKNEIRAVTGLEPVLRGAVSVSLFPSGAVNFADVLLGDQHSDRPALAAERLTAHLRLLPLLIGRIEISDISLTRPRIAITFAPDGSSNWSVLLAALAGAKPNAERSNQTVSFSEMRIDDGMIIARDETHEVTETLTNAELSLAWPSISKSFVATGHFVWRDNPVEGNISVSDFIAALKGEHSGLKFRVSSSPLKLAFDGSMSSEPTLKIEGTLAADAPSLRDALRWSGQKSFPGGGFGHFALKAKTDLGGGAISLSSVNVELDGNTAEGVLKYEADGRRILQGTLAADNLELTPYVSTVRLLAANARDWDRVPIKLEGFNNFDVDLRLSAARVEIGNAKLGRTGVTANLRAGQLVVTVGESQAFGGEITGSFGVAPSEAGADLKTQMQFRDVDLQTCLNDLFGIRNLDGKGTLAVALEGSGNSVMALTQTLSGTATLNASQGSLAGFNVEQFLRTLGGRPLTLGAGGLLRNGRTSYDKLTANINVVQGTANVDDIRIEGPTVRVALAGAVSIPAREVNLKGTAGLVQTAGETAGAFELPFVVQGPWDYFSITADPQSLMRRSPAAASLIDAVKDRKVRDALGTAIDRLTGARPAAAPAATSDAQAPEQPR